MTHSNANSYIYQKKVILGLFLFALVVLTGRVLYNQFTSFSVSLSDLDQGTELAGISPEFFHREAIASARTVDPSLTLYRSAASRADVLWFYTHITGSEEISRVILENASKNNVPPSLAFALAWAESNYQPMAVGRNATSIDRGLFQLNNRAFPKLTEREFFNIETNAHYGLSHLSYCLDLSGNEVAALAMYNAGPTKVANNNTPRRTLDYVSKILNYKQGLERLFNQQVASRYQINGSEVHPLPGSTQIAGRK